MASVDTLLLKVTDYLDDRHWLWVLTDNAGSFLADHEVSLNAKDPNYRAFLDLQTYINLHSSPVNRVQDQLLLLDEMSTWIGSNVLGKVADRLAHYCIPVTVRVSVPPEASGLAYLPLEIARIGDKPLALRDISLVFELEGPELDILPVGEKLRILAIFSMPTDVSALALRRERYELMKLIDHIAQTHSLAIELKVLQYGATYGNLRDALKEEKGWDIIHLSGHGERATIILENPDGAMDPITSGDLANLLSLARGRIKLVTLSSCLSAAATLEETMKWLKIQAPEKVQEAEDTQKSGVNAIPSLARQLVADLDCAVLAMRYSVGDEFAIKLAEELYKLLLGKGQTLPRALQLSIRVALKRGYNAATPPLSLATPALFGRLAADLVIKPHKVTKRQSQQLLPGIADFPPEPRSFVGRSGPLIRASSALAPGWDKRGVLFHGMAGGGKTACALELAHHQSRTPRFEVFVWYKAPDQGKDIDRALLDLATEIETQLPGFKMVHVVDDIDAFKKFLPILKQLLEEKRMLIVLDNLESLLNSQGNWKDDRWGMLVETLLDHNGKSRTILTSRQPPKSLQAERLIVETIHTLSLKESILLAREMPNLGRLLMGKSTVSPEKGRGLVRRTLSLVQGHPKLIEMAESQAGDPLKLECYLDRAAQAWGDESRLMSFFQSGESSKDAGKFLEVLGDWTRGISETLPMSARTLFHFLCALEEPDRLSWIVGQVWAELWKRQGQSSQAPSTTAALQDLKALVDVQALREGARYAIHPGVVETGMAEQERSFRLVVEEVMAEFWEALFKTAESQEQGGLIIHAALNAAPYLMRLERWQKAAYHLQEAIIRDSSPGTIITALSMLRRIVDVTRGTREGLHHAGTLSTALRIAGRWQEAEERLRILKSECLDQREFESASAAACDLFNILGDTGRPEEALQLAEEMKRYTLQAGLGPWTQLLDEGLRLQALNQLGRYGEVLDAVKTLRQQMDVLPKQSDQEERVTTWNVREMILDTGRSAALLSGEYGQALELNAEVLKLMQARGVNELGLAQLRFNDYSPLLKLERYDEASKLLWDCKKVFEREKDIEALGKVFAALAELENESGRTNQAIRFLGAALRYTYLIGNIEDIIMIHLKLGISLQIAGSDKAQAHTLAAAVICFQTGYGLYDYTLQRLSIDLDRLGIRALPDNFDQLCRTVEEIEGVTFRKLFIRLAGQDADGDQIMQKVIEIAKGGN